MEGLDLRLFGSSGVRGLVNVDLSAVLAEKIGLAVATFAKARSVVVARDTRTTGAMLENALVSGVESAGANVKCLGIIPTPLLAFLTKELRADAGIMITASHNPPEYNGIKIFDSHGLAYDEGAQDEIERIVTEKKSNQASWKSVGSAQQMSKSCLYVKNLKRKIRLRRKWHVVVDPGCGATFSLAPTVMQGLGCRVTALNAQPDGWFPARRSEPDAESLEPLMRVVKVLGADAGLAYDGDGDRVAFADENGNFSDFDRVLAAYAAHVVQENGGGIVVTSVEASMSLEKMVEGHGGKVVRTKVGDVYVAEQMRRYNAIFGGEPCGAWIHPKFHLCPDGILSSALVLEALEDENKKLSEFVASAPSYPMFRKNFKCENEQKEKALKRIAENLKSTFAECVEFSKLDGVRLVTEQGWLLVRPSGTEPTLRLTVEGESLNAAKQIMKRAANLIKNTLGNGPK